MDDLTSTQVASIAIIIIWEFIWKGFALWRAGRKNDKLWFVLLFLTNTFGLLPIVYIFFVSKGKDTSKE